jgi:murein DD-endopeptidase MepM/ murein hydrolase activator NlpD
MRGSILVHPGEHVAEGVTIGACGNSGYSFLPHLHIHAVGPDGLGRAIHFNVVVEHVQAPAQEWVDRYLTAGVSTRPPRTEHPDQRDLLRYGLQELATGVMMPVVAAIFWSTLVLVSLLYLSR